MATDDQQVLVVGQASAPATFKIPGNGQITPRTIYAHFDGTAAATPFSPAIKITSDGGKLIGIYPAPTVVAGGSAEVSWFPHVAAGSGSGATQTFIGATLRGQTLLVADNAQADLTYGSVEFDTNGMTNLVADNRKITINTPGYYLVMVSTLWAYNNSGRRINALIRNDFWSNALSVSQVADSRMQPWDPFPGHGLGGNSDNLCWRIYHANAGDFFSSGVYQNSGAAINCNSGGPPSAFFSAALIGT